MFRQTVTFREYKASAPYTVNCSECGFCLKRQAVVGHTVNPFNKNPDGSVKTAAEVQRDAYEAAKVEAAKLAEKPTKCRWCDERECRELLLEMATEPERHLPEPARYWASPLHTLVERKQAEEDYRRDEATSGGWRSLGYRITAKGLKRAEQLRAEANRRVATSRVA